ncbi:glycosyltransferase family 2 protein [Nocardioides sp. B-3]|uniref:glycosyltransferase family 2 protein n=1 Tax=Nocardioides sp. B-3 TaxID=2895565 RepID=UPI003FA60548
MRDRAPDLARLLDALPPSVPVIVVDDGSRDPSAIARVTADHGARLVVHDVNRGPAAARNTGLRHVATPVRRVLRLRRGARSGLAGHPATPPRRPRLGPRRTACARPVAPAGRQLDRPLRAGALLPRPRPGAGGRPATGGWWPTCPALACSPASPSRPGPAASTRRCAAARTSTRSGGCSPPVPAFAA